MKKYKINEIENEIKKEKYKIKYKSILKSTIYAFIIIISISCLIASLLLPVIEVTEKTVNLNKGDIILAIKTKKLKIGDIVAFYQGNKILIKRVIGTPSDWVYIDENGIVSINGTVLEEPYIQNKAKENIEYLEQVKEKKLFVLNDDRTQLTDSRNPNIGQIEEENIIGKVILRIWPFKNKEDYR